MIDVHRIQGSVYFWAPQRCRRHRRFVFLLLFAARVALINHSRTIGWLPDGLTVDKKRRPEGRL